MSLNQQKFLKILSNPSPITDEELEALQQAVKKYPYFQLGHSLIAKAKYDRQSPDANDALHLAAIYAPSRLCLRQLFYNETQNSDTTAQKTETPGVTATPEEPASREADSTTGTPEDISQETATPQSQDENVYRELEENLQHLRTSRQQQDTEETTKPTDSRPEQPAHNTKSTSSSEQEDYPYLMNHLKNADPIQTDQAGDQQRSQMELIDKFINSGRDVRIRWRYQEDAPQDLSEKNILSSGSLVTENLAEIYVKQEKKDKAIEIYQKLILKYPDKKTYFAEKIESLKEN